MLVDIKGQKFEIVNADEFPEDYSEVRKRKEKKESKNKIKKMTFNMPRELADEFKKKCEENNTTMTQELLEFISKFNNGYKGKRITI